MITKKRLEKIDKEFNICVEKRKAKIVKHIDTYVYMNSGEESYLDISDIESKFYLVYKFNIIINSNDFKKTKYLNALDFYGNLKLVLRNTRPDSIRRMTFNLKQAYNICKAETDLAKLEYKKKKSMEKLNKKLKEKLPNKVISTEKKNKI